MEILHIHHAGMVSCPVWVCPPFSCLWISKSYFFPAESVPYASRQIERAPASRFISFCVWQLMIIRSGFPVIMRNTSSAKGMLSLKRQRMKSSSIGLKLRSLSRSFWRFALLYPKQSPAFSNRSSRNFLCSYYHKCLCFSRSV